MSMKNIAMAMLNAQKKIKTHVSIDKNTGCWDWKGTINNYGYGIICINYKRHVAHRFVYESLKTKIPEGMFACHKCDNPSCVNPDHIFIGTAKDNMRDCVKKGRLKTPFKTKKSCRNGHEFSGDNTKRDRRGFKYCDVCKKEREKKRLVEIRNDPNKLKEYLERGARNARNKRLRDKNGKQKNV